MIELPWAACRLVCKPIPRRTGWSFGPRHPAPGIRVTWIVMGSASLQRSLVARSRLDPENSAPFKARRLRTGGVSGRRRLAFRPPVPPGLLTYDLPNIRQSRPGSSIGRIGP